MRQKSSENSNETGAQNERQMERCNLGKQKLCLSRTKTLVITRVSHKYSQKYYINIPLSAFQADALGMFIMKHLGLRRIKNSLNEGATYFCRCLSLTQSPL